MDQLDPRDIPVLRMLAGAHFGPGAEVTLPSGRKLGAAEMQALTSAYAPAYDASRYGGDPDEIGHEAEAVSEEVAARPVAPVDAQLVAKIRMRGGDADVLLGEVARRYGVRVEELPRAWWQRTPAKLVTIPYPGDQEYKLLSSQLMVRLGAFSNTSLHVWTEPA